MSRLRTGILVVMVALALIMPANLALAGNPNPQVLPPSSAYGMTYGQWGAAFWQWVTLCTPANQVMFDTTGQFAWVNQIPSGSVFFLTGTWTGSDPVVRNVTVPAGKAFFFPVYNWVLTYPEDVPDANLKNEKQAENWIRNRLNEQFAGTKAEDLVCIVDGATVKNPLAYRAQSPAFAMYFPPDCYEVLVDSSFSNPTDPPTHYLAGLHYPTVSDGYWIMLAPFPAGLHTIQIQCGPPGARWVDVTYNLTVQ